MDRYDIDPEWDHIMEIPAPDQTKEEIKKFGSELIAKIKTRFPNRKSKGLSIPRVLPNEKIPVLSYEHNGSMVRFDMWESRATNVITDSERGKACDLGQAQPVAMVINGKPYLGFTIDGDHGVGLRLNLEKTALELTSTAEEAYAYLESAKFSRIFTEDLTGRQRLMFIVIGLIIGQLLFFLFKV